MQGFQERSRVVKSMRLLNSFEPLPFSFSLTISIMKLLFFPAVRVCGDYEDIRVINIIVLNSTLKGRLVILSEYHWLEEYLFVEYICLVP